MSNQHHESTEANSTDQAPAPQLETGMPRAVWIFFAVVVIAIVTSLMLE